MDRIDNIINEEINKAIISEGVMDSIRNLFKEFTKKKHKSKEKNSEKKTKEELRKERKLKKKAAKDRKGRKKVRKLAKGGSKYYDYDDYQMKHRKISKGDADSIIDTVDQENTDIAAVADDVLPDHTKAGAQSHLRKILNHERPMTKDIASKLEKMISAGEIAVK